MKAIRQSSACPLQNTTTVLIPLPRCSCIVEIDFAPGVCISLANIVANHGLSAIIAERFTSSKHELHHHLHCGLLTLYSGCPSF